MNKTKIKNSVKGGKIWLYLHVELELLISSRDQWKLQVSASQNECPFQNCKNKPQGGNGILAQIDHMVSQLVSQ